MARHRTIKPEFWTSEQVMECSPIARLLFIGMWNFADDHGRLSMSTKTLKAQVFPGDDEVTTEAIRRMIDELSSNGLVRQYVVDGKEYLLITGWHHQKIDRPQKPKHPEPPADHSSNTRRTFAPEREKEREKEDAASAAPSSKTYAFESGVIKLNQKDFDLWKASFSNLDVPAELLAMTAWAAEQRSWFNAVKGALAKRNREVKAAKDKQTEQGGFRWNGGMEGII